MEIIITENVKEFIRTLDENHDSRVEKHFALLAQFGNYLRMPYSKCILPKIFELRVGGIQNLRIIYTFDEGKAIVFHGFSKKTEKIELHEINVIKLQYNSLHL